MESSVQVEMGELRENFVIAWCSGVRHRNT